MLRKRALVALMTAAVAGLPLAMVGINQIGASASSHREAPTISTDPGADGTDVYAFVDPNNNALVDIIANYYPFQTPSGGPNFYPFAKDVQYQIHVDSNGTATDSPGLRFNFTFQNATANPNTFLYNTGPMKFSGGSYTNWNASQTMTMTEARDGANTACNPASGLVVPPDNVGRNSIDPSTTYAAMATSAINNVQCGGAGAANQVTVFAGQRGEAFFADLGGIFDLFGLGLGTNYLAGFNVNTIAIQVPKTLLKTPATPAGQNNVIGIWSTSSRSATTTISGPTRTGSGGQVQVSRLGMPLVNEVVVPLAVKDFFNTSQPVNDAGSNGFAPAVTQPVLAAILKGIDPNVPLGAPPGTTGPGTTSARADLVSTFLVGLTALGNVHNNQGGQLKLADELRFKYDPAPTAPGTQNRLGALAGQADGFPNGRRLGDDIVDIEVQVAAGILCDHSHYPAFAAQFAASPAGGMTSECRTPGHDVPAALGDGSNAADAPFLSTFPYMPTPYSGH